MSKTKAQKEQLKKGQDLRYFFKLLATGRDALQRKEIDCYLILSALYPELNKPKHHQLLLLLVPNIISCMNPTISNAVLQGYSIGASFVGNLCCLLYALMQSD